MTWKKNLTFVYFDNVVFKLRRDALSRKINCRENNIFLMYCDGISVNVLNYFVVLEECCSANEISVKIFENK